MNTPSICLILRLKRLLEQEKAHQTRQDQEHRRSVKKMSAELLKLQALAIMLLDERQLHIQQIHQHGQNFQDLDRQLQDREQQLEAVAAAAKEDSQRILILEAELEQQVAEFTRQQEEKSGRLVEEEGHSRKLRMKMAALAQQVEELQQSNKLLRVSEENLHELKEKIRQGEQGSSFLSAQLESLKKKVVEMEGQDEEISKLETQCRELKGKLHKEENHSQDLRLQVEQLQGKMAELEKLQGALSNSRAESSQLRTHLEKEKDLVRGLSNKIDTMRHSIKLLENSASNLEKAEVSLKDQLVKMKSLTILLAEERKKVTERLRLEEQRSLKLSRTLEEEQAKVTEVTEKLIDESKKLLKVKSEAENQVTSLVKEKTELGNKLAAEEEKNQHLRTEVGDMKIRVESLEKQEEVEKSERPEKDKKIQELMLELEKLRSRLEQLQVVEGDLMKTEDQYDVLQEKFRREQEKADVLSKNLDEMRSQVARSKVVERKEISGPEAALRIRCKLEEVRTRELQLDVQALREKIQQLMNHEEQLLADRALLQQRLMEEEQRRRISSQEVEKLCQELEASRRVARTFRPHGGRMSSVPVVSTAVQTELEEAEVGGEQTAAGFILRSLLEEQHLMRNLRRQEVRTSEHPPSCKSWLREKGEQRSMALGTRSLGEPLRIRVTPDPGSSRATLEISGAAAANDFFSSATIVPTLGLQQPRITIHPSAQATPRGDTVGGANSPVSIAKSPAGGANTFTARQRSPLSVITVSAAPVVEAPPPTHHQPTLVTMTPPPANRKLDGGRSSIITTNDNKIHIQLGCQYKRPTLDEVGAGCSSLEGSKGAQSGTSVHLLRCPPQGKMTSSLTITPVTSTSDRPTQTQVSATKKNYFLLRPKGVSGSFLHFLLHLAGENLCHNVASCFPMWRCNTAT